jgi:hypothetical protein
MLKVISAVTIFRVQYGIFIQILNLNWVIEIRNLHASNFISICWIIVAATARHLRELTPGTVEQCVPTSYYVIRLLLDYILHHCTVCDKMLSS